MSGAIYPFLDDLNSVLNPHFAGTKYEQLFVGNFVDRVYTFDTSLWQQTLFWNPAQLTRGSDEYKIYCTLGYHMHLINEILDMNNITNDIKYQLCIYMDMYIPLMIHMEDEDKYSDEYLLTDYGEGAPIHTFGPTTDTVFHQGKIPNVLNYIVQCSFWSDVRSKDYPIVHLLSKGLPQRCQIRNMREILSNYSRKYDTVYEFIYSCLLCSLLGMYKSCTVRPPLNIRIRLYRKFRSMSKAEMLQWMIQDHQQLLFYVIKEFLIFGVHEIPSIYAEIERRYYWDKFEQCVAKAMNTVRSSIEDNANIMHFKGVEPQLIAINKQQVHHLFRPTRHLFCHVIINECEKIDDSKYIDYIRKETPLENKDIMYQMAIRTEELKCTPFEWLQYFNVKEDIIKNLKKVQDTYIQDGSKGSLKSLLEGMDRYTFECVRDLCEVFDRKNNVRLFTLPKHIYIQQCQALRRKHEIQNNCPIDQDTGSSYVCLECKQFKGFVTGIDKGKVKNLYAYGHSKILIDDETMELYCGKRSDKVDGKKRNVIKPEYTSFIDVDYQRVMNANEIRHRKRQAKEKRKDLRSKVCSKTPLVSVNLLGVLLQYYGKLYTMCPVCANFMLVTSEHFTKDGFYCGCCMQHGKLYTNVSCEWCHAIRGNESWTPIKVKDNENKEMNIYLCQQCHKPWIRNAETILPLDTIKKGLTQRWKRLQHPGL